MGSVIYHMGSARIHGRLKVVPPVKWRDDASRIKPHFTLSGSFQVYLLRLRMRTIKADVAQQHRTLTHQRKAKR